MLRSCPTTRKSFAGGSAVNFRYENQSVDYGRTEGILFANRNEGQRDGFSERIPLTELQRVGWIRAVAV